MGPGKELEATTVAAPGASMSLQRLTEKQTLLVFPFLKEKLKCLIFPFLQSDSFLLVRKAGANIVSLFK